jgi:hypothetical protein
VGTYSFWRWLYSTIKLVSQGVAEVLWAVKLTCVVGDKRCDEVQVLSGQGSRNFGNVRSQTVRAARKFSHRLMSLMWLGLSSGVSIIEPATGPEWALYADPHNIPGSTFPEQGLRNTDTRKLVTPTSRWAWEMLRTKVCMAKSLALHVASPISLYQETHNPVTCPTSTEQP